MKVLRLGMDKFGPFGSLLRNPYNARSNYCSLQGGRISAGRLSFLLLIFLIQVLFVLGSCGKKGPPKPPEETFFIEARLHTQKQLTLS
jgi:predicted small lipoprotein YifL